MITRKRLTLYQINLEKTFISMNVLNHIGCLVEMIDECHPDFYKVLGYLASPVRQTKLDIETHPRRKASLEKEYFALTREKLVTGTNYILLPQESNKWGCELRIYFRKNGNIPPSLDAMVVTPRFSTGYHNARINGNDFIWKLIEFGFRATNVQNADLIRSKVSQKRVAQFDDGLLL